MQFVDFAMTAVHQLLNNAGTLHYRTGIAAPLVVRAPCGGGFAGGPFHSEELEALFCHMPGIKVIYPAFPADARALLLGAALDPNPVVFLENKYLYRHVKEWLPVAWGPAPLGAARVCRPGRDAVILTYGAMVHEALRAAERIHSEDGGEVMVLDLRTLKPIDTDAIFAAVAATNRVLIVHEGWRTGGFGAEIAALVAERAFHLLDAPIRRLTAPDCPVPFAPQRRQDSRGAGRTAGVLRNCHEKARADCDATDGPKRGRGHDHCLEEEGWRRRPEGRRAHGDRDRQDQRRD
jgi:2-oxoisovalerate dehydrogenase E1 component beta subunit